MEWKTDSEGFYLVTTVIKDARGITYSFPNTEEGNEEKQCVIDGLMNNTIPFSVSFAPTEEE